MKQLVCLVCVSTFIAVTVVVGYSYTSRAQEQTPANEVQEQQQQQQQQQQPDEKEQPIDEAKEIAQKRSYAPLCPVTFTFQFGGFYYYDALDSCPSGGHFATSDMRAHNLGCNGANCIDPIGGTYDVCRRNARLVKARPGRPNGPDHSDDNTFSTVFRGAGVTTAEAIGNYTYDPGNGPKNVKLRVVKATWNDGVQRTQVIAHECWGADPQGPQLQIDYDENENTAIIAYVPASIQGFQAQEEIDILVLEE